ncbi:hypothetical protein GTQ99_05480 [Kineococcus sp. T13]|uniref:DUF2470 domain-containing protein n=1 Tax=Kineococcus vitellinus TaxID=2696565 RepID=UPI001412476F|nr:DUF2470 domain-containing protein [Kineococcus vitellinus]NAZ74877.1 hypothetical protein [Kineococcus vitellinus]
MPPTAATSQPAPGAVPAPAAPLAPARPTPAQWARTLAVGTVAGTLHLPPAAGACPHRASADPGAPAGEGARAGRRTEAHPVQHLTDAWGGLLLLVDEGGALQRRLAEVDAGDRWDRVPAVLDVLDVPPGQAALPRARLGVTGWVEPVGAGDQRRLAATAAAVRPLGALLDVGTTRRLWRLEVADVRVTTATGVHLLEDEEFTAAAPDPLYDDEDGIVAHVEAVHRDALVGWVLATLPPERASAAREVAVVGVDRFGMDVLVTVGSSTTLLRAAFAEPVRHEHELPHALCRLFACPCGGSGPRSAPHG